MPAALLHFLAERSSVSIEGVHFVAQAHATGPMKDDAGSLWRFGEN